MTLNGKLLSQTPRRTGYRDFPFQVRYEDETGRVMCLDCETYAAAMAVIRENQPSVRDQLAASLSGGWN